ncbi:MAG: galactokinase, partial [Ruminococcaceae bacterium]|nr:galactokinase [Oscillospiraceae bacterium]
MLLFIRVNYMDINTFFNKIDSSFFDSQLYTLYGEDIKKQKTRYKNAVLNFTKLYPNRSQISLFSSPGRTEVCGNHTDHQHGCVLAGSVNLDMLAVVSFHNDGVVRVKSDGYDSFEVSCDNLIPDKTQTTASLVKGVLAGFRERGITSSGFDMYVTSDVLSGSGLSSSAAFEVLVGYIVNSTAQNKLSIVEIAKIGMYAENVFFGKKCGLMDQTACSYGGLVGIDFLDPENPKITKVDLDLKTLGYALCITDTKSSHADLNDDFAAIIDEMKEVSHAFGKEYLEDVCEAEFLSQIPKLYNTLSHRAILRATHYFDETRRVKAATSALIKHDFKEFLNVVSQSAHSSETLLQNLYSISTPQSQAIPLALTISRKFLLDSGLSRVHGGGFAGTVQAYVPL